jgi:hypothetical protein
MDIPIQRGYRRYRRQATVRQRSRLLSREQRSLPHFSLVYFALLLVVFGTVAATLVFDRSKQVQLFGPNLATELLGIIATLTFVQRLLVREERARKLRAAVGPLRKCHSAFSDFLAGWSMLLRGGFDPRRTELPRTFEELLTSDYTNDLAALDPRSPTDDAGTWLELGIRQLVGAQARLREVIGIYGATLDPAYLEAIDELADDSFVTFLEQLCRREPSAHQWRVALNQARGCREGHFVRLVHALTVHNGLSEEAARFRSRHLAPNTHSLTLQRRADYDLTVQLELGREWWSAAPEIGALRAVVTRHPAGSMLPVGEVRTPMALR